MAQDILQRLIASLTPPPAPSGGYRPLPTVDPHPTRGKEAFATGMDLILGGLGVNDPLDPKATKATGLGSLVGMISPLAIAGSLQRAGRGLYSRVDDALRLLPAKGAHPNKVRSLLQNNASAEELAYRGVPQFLEAQGNAMVTPEMMASHLKARPAPMPEKQVLQRRVDNSLPSTDSPSTSPKYANYQVPGGKDYRETLSTLPVPSHVVEYPRGFSQVRQDVHGDKQWYRVTDGGEWDTKGYATREAATADLDAPVRVTEPIGRPFDSPHFDTPNVLVHTRSNTRALPTGESGRFLEEVQSDWHQQGKAKGYATSSPKDIERFRPGALAAIQQYDNLGFDSTREALDAAISHPDWATRWDMRDANPNDVRLIEQYAQSVRGSRGVPDAPFKDSWPDLGLKQEILAAVDDPNAQWIGHTTGATQAARYDLSKQISRVEYDRKGASVVEPGQAGRVRAYDHDGKVVVDQFVPESKLPDYIGKEATEKLLTGDNAARLDMGVGATLSGLDLQVGGEGMRSFYDELLPKRLEKILKPFGGKVERGQATTLANPALDQRIDQGGGRNYTKPGFDTVEAWIARLSPEIKARIREQGLPLLMAMIAARGGLAPSHRQLDTPAPPVRR